MEKSKEKRKRVKNKRRGKRKGGSKREKKKTRKKKRKIKKTKYLKCRKVYHEDCCGLQIKPVEEQLKQRVIGKRYGISRKRKS